MSRLRVASLIGILSVAALAAVSCQNTANTGTEPGAGGGVADGTSTGSGNGGGSAAIVTFQPTGCAFSVQSRPEYIGYQPGGAMTAAAPNIRRVRLGLGGNVVPGGAGHADPSTSIGVAWQTDEGTAASDVEWGPSPDPTSWPTGNRTSGVTWDTPEAELNTGQGNERMHEAYVCGLTSATTYYYRVGGGAAGAEQWSDVYAFTTTPSSGTAAPVKIALTGDSRGEQENAWQLLQGRVNQAGVTMQLFSGDMINLAPDQTEWELWLDSAWKDTSGNLSALGQLLTLAAHGNHDNHTSLFYGNLVLPQDVQTYAAYVELFYSVDVGPVHVVVVDDSFIADPTEDPSYASILKSWLDQDLGAATANRGNVPWIVTVHHRPEYSSSLHGMDLDVLNTREFFAPIWEQYKVNLAVGGHDHDYERSKPLSGSADAPTIHSDTRDGTTYLVCAGAGADGYSKGTNPWTAISSDFTSGGAIGFYAYLTATTNGMTLESHELRTDASDPVIDTLTFTP
jgi:hypothetical protein